MKYQVFAYVIKVWLTSVIAGPLLSMIWLIAYNSTQASQPVARGLIVQDSDFQILIIMVLIGAMLSLPSMAIFYLATRFGISLLGNTLKLKGILSIAGTLFTYIPFLFHDNFHPLLNINMLSRPLFLTYSVMIVAGIWLYKIKPVPQPFIEPPETIHI